MCFASTCVGEEEAAATQIKCLRGTHMLWKPASHVLSIADRAHHWHCGFSTTMSWKNLLWVVSVRCFDFYHSNAKVTNSFACWGITCSCTHACACIHMCVHEHTHMYSLWFVGGELWSVSVVPIQLSLQSLSRYQIWVWKINFIARV